MTKRSILNTSVLAIFLVATACAPAAPPPAQSGGTAPNTTKPAEPVLAANQTITVGTSQLAPTLDAHANIGAGARRYGLFEMIVDQKADGSVEPSIASEWKLVNDLTWEFKLAPNHKWHDGTPVTVEDIKFSIDRAINPANKLGVLVRVPTVKSATIVNPTTFQIGTTGPDPILLKRLAAVSIFPKAYLEKVGDAQFGVKPIGSGPYKMKEYVPDQQLVMTSVPEHPSKPTLTEVTIKMIPDVSALLAGLRTGALQMIDRASLEQANKLQGEGFNLVSLNPGRSMGITLNLFVGGPLADKRVRQALNYAVDKELIAKNIFFGFAAPETGQLLQKETFGFHPGLKAYPYDVAMAKKLLAEAGYPNGFKVKFWVNPSSPEWQPTALFVQQQYKDIGVELDMTISSDAAAYQDRFYGRVPRPEFLSGNISNGPAMDASFALDWYRSNQPEPQRRYSNPEFDKFYEPSLNEMNETKRLELLQKALEVYRDDPPHVFFVSLPEIWAASNKVMGLERRTDAMAKYEQIKLIA